MEKLKKYTVFFLIGGFGYAAIELLWRGYTHPSMIAAGGICFILISLIAERMQGTPLPIKAVLCALCVTAVEFIFGLIFNIALKMHVWDYSDRPYNLLGQVCLHFSLLWVALSFFCVPLAQFLNRKIFR